MLLQGSRLVLEHLKICVPLVKIFQDQNTPVNVFQQQIQTGKGTNLLLCKAITGMARFVHPGRWQSLELLTLFWPLAET